MVEDRWLSKKEYSRIRYKAKKIGARRVRLNQLWHLVEFDYVTVAFMFKPLQCHASIRVGHPLCGHFSDSIGAEKIKMDIDRATEFMNFLRQFDEQLNDEK